MKNLILLFFTFLSINTIYSQSTCATADPICSEGIDPRESGLNNPSYGNIGCCFTTPNAAWFTFKIASAGTSSFSLHQGDNAPAYDNNDVDFVCWGPFYDDSNCSELFDFPDGNTNGGVNNIVACSYSPDATENFSLPYANAGAYFILLITNFSNDPGYFVLEDTSAANEAHPDCSVVCGLDLGPVATSIYPDNITTLPICDPATTSIPLHCVFENPPANPTALAYKWYWNGALQTGLTTSSITVTQSGLWKVEATHPDCGTPYEDSINVIFAPRPVLTSPGTQPGALGDCNPVFNLTSLIPTMLAPLNPANYAITWC